MSITYSLECPSDKVYAKIIKKTKQWGNEESFTITAGTTVEYTSPTLTPNVEREFETCFPITSNHLYTHHEGFGI